MNLTLYYMGHVKLVRRQLCRILSMEELEEIADVSECAKSDFKYFVVPHNNDGDRVKWFYIDNIVARHLGKNCMIWKHHIYDLYDVYIEPDCDLIQISSMLIVPRR